MSGWATVESDAAVFTFLIEKLQASGVQADELLALDEEVLREMSPIGVIFLFKYPTGEQRSAGDEPLDGKYDYGAAEDIFFARQVINNACGTQALLSILLNHPSEMTLGPQLDSFLEFVSSFPAELRGEALSNSESIRTAHNSFARASPFVDETVRQATADDDVYHFIAYTSINDVMYELDGLQPAPISHGPCSRNDFADKIVPVLRKRIERYPAAEIRFNLLAVVRDWRAVGKERGDFDLVERENARRREWQWENALRRHNWIGFAGQVLKQLAASNLQQGRYDDWIEHAKKDFAARRERQKQLGQTFGSGDGMVVDE